MKIDSKGILIIFAISVLFFIFLAHTILLTKGYTFYVYEAVRDVSIILISLVLGGYNIIQALKNKSFIAYLILANLFAMIATIHLLRLIFGGLLC